MLADVISGLIGLIGILLLSYGAFLFAPPFGFITLGAALIMFSFLFARASALNNQKKK